MAPKMPDDGLSETSSGEPRKLNSGANREEQAIQPSKSFYEELLNTGMFSDVTIHFGEGYEFKGHSVILKQKSKWFAENYSGQSTMDIGDVARGFVHSILAEDVDWKHDGLDSECLCSPGLQSMLRFCYTTEYPYGDLKTLLEHEPIIQSPGLVCEIYLCMALLGIKFGVPDLVTHCVERFSTAADRVREAIGGQPQLTFLINKIYDLPDTEGYKELRKAARQQAFKMITEATKELSTMMPKASQDILRGEDDEED